MIMAGSNGRGRFGALFLWALLAVMIASAGCLTLTAQPPDCSPSTDALEAMPTKEFLVDRQARSIDVKVAATDQHRAAGMQHLCAETVSATPILFLFDDPATPAFHMNNVHVSLDIVFIGPDQQVIGVARMRPNQRTLTRPPGPVIAALELAAGQAEDLGIEPGIQVQWREKE